MRRFKTYLALLLSITTLILACKHDPEVMPSDQPQDNGSSNNNPEDYGTNPADTIETPCSVDSVYFFNDILPIIISRCAMAGCHNVANEENNFIALTSFEGITEIAQDGMDSELIDVINEDNPDEIMPRQGSLPLTSSEIDLIESWVDQGAEKNACKSCVTTASFANDIFPIIFSNCIGCHSAYNPSGNLLLTNHAQVSNAASRIVSRIEGYGGIMPPQSNGIPTCEKEQIKNWIEAGKPNN